MNGGDRAWNMVDSAIALYVAVNDNRATVHYDVSPILSAYPGHFFLPYPYQDETLIDPKGRYREYERNPGIPAIVREKHLTHRSRNNFSFRLILKTRNQFCIIVEKPA